ncbi:MAG: tyrosine-protein phosphatase [Myxococcales bacterium]|nr:tyrosine-protein phosphatase [Myxococcales bacterium]
MTTLAWEGAYNVRDLSGAHPSIACGAFVRADHLCYLRPAGWEALQAWGVRTVVDLRNEDEKGRDRARPADLVTVAVELDGASDEAWWAPWRSGWQFGTPLYYRPHVEAFPDRLASALIALADAAPGGVAFHCMAGRDRTGMVAIALLRLLEVPVEDIVRDYLRSVDGVAAAHAAHDAPDPGVEIAAWLREQGLDLGQLVADFAEWPELTDHLRRGGLRDEHVWALRRRASV